MKILQVSNFLTPVHGGSAEVPWQLSKALVKNGHDVTIYTSNFKLDLSSLPAIGVNINTFKTWLQLASFDITPGMVKKAMEEIGNFDVIHLHNYRTFQNIVAHHYAKKYGIPYVLQAHGSLTTYFQKGALKKIFDVAWGHEILKDTSKVIALTITEAEQYKSMGISENKIEVVPNGVDLSEFENLPERGEFRRKYGINNDQKVILYLGRINKIKGLGLLVEAFANALKELNGAKLVVVGPDDGYLMTLKKLIKELEIEEEVLFTGPLYREDRLKAYLDADVYVLSSVYETFPIGVLEAWACGKPVIVTDRCGLADVVEGRAGLVVPYDKVQLRGALSKMLDDAAMRLEFGRQGKKLVKEQYNWPGIASQMASVYNSIVANRARLTNPGRF